MKHTHQHLVSCLQVQSVGSGGEKEAGAGQKSKEGVAAVAPQAAATATAAGVCLPIQ